MKKILLMAMAATMFAACTQNEEFENEVSNKEMKFNTAVMSSTRAGAMTNAKFETFTLYAYTGTANATPIIGGETFTKTDQTWTPTTLNAKFYWPGTQSVNFYGYSVEEGGATYSQATVASPTLAYTVKTDIANQADLLIANTSLTATADGSAPIPFTHALTRMSFTITGDDASTSIFAYGISSIEISANISGTYEYANKGWNATTGTSSKFTLTASASSFNGGASVSVNEALMMIPQSGATIKINYTIKVAGQDVPTPVEKSFTFDNWEQGKNIAYTIKLPSDAIKQIVVSGEFKDGEWANAATSGTTTPVVPTPEP